MDSDQQRLSKVRNQEDGEQSPNAARLRHTWLHTEMLLKACGCYACPFAVAMRPCYAV